ncbi:ABC transporter permease [Clostridium polyendosporum]|uniref:ABC transporter permease n=1 Tax=Clostridium polyendosporum TaxID=69208 RepID=A0A919RYH7_9CLOT|nr:ABC transporter permease [Clostridium polyendosporum]
MKNEVSIYAPSDKKKKRLAANSTSLGREREKMILGIMFIIPALILLFTFLILPTILAFKYSFYDYNILMPAKTSFIGLKNYITVLKDETFWNAMKNTFYFVVLVVPFQTALALFLAILINKKSKVTNVFRIGFFSPVITSIVVISILWTFLYSKTGLINNFLGLFGIPPQPFLTSEKQAMNSIIFMSAWQAAGYFMMIFLAGLQDIPKHLYEAASIDGANKIQEFWYVTLPGLKNVFKFVILMTTIQAFKLFQQPFIMTGGGPNGSTETVVQLIYKEGFQYRNAGYSSAIAIIFFLIIITISIGMQKLLTEKTA